MARQRIGILGGTFDPVHLGHVIAAQDAFEQMELDRVIFMPVHRAPLKDREPGASDEMRLRLLRAALHEDSRFEVSTLEIERGGTSYTIDTAEALRRDHPDCELFWIIGSDQAARLHQWHRIDVLAGMLQFIVLSRPGYELPERKFPSILRLHLITAHVFDISSSEIRRRVASGKPVRAFVPAPVFDLIQRHGVYR